MTGEARKERRQHPMDPTPGPWRVSGTNAGWLIMDERREVAIALVYGAKVYRVGEDRAPIVEPLPGIENADLLLAAVNSYDAYKKLAEAARKVEREWSCFIGTEQKPGHGDLPIVSAKILALRRALKAVEETDK